MKANDVSQCFVSHRHGDVSHHHLHKVQFRGSGSSRLIISHLTRNQFAKSEKAQSFLTPPGRQKEVSSALWPSYQFFPSKKACLRIPVPGNIFHTHRDSEHHTHRIFHDVFWGYSLHFFHCVRWYIETSRLGFINHQQLVILLIGYVRTTINL